MDKGDQSAKQYPRNEEMDEDKQIWLSKLRCLDRMQFVGIQCYLLCCCFIDILVDGPVNMAQLVYEFPLAGEEGFDCTW